MPSRSSRISTGLFAACISVFMLSGCGSGKGTPAAPPPPPPPTGFSGSAFAGKVLSGTVSIKGATVQLYAAGAAGSGSAGIPLLATSLSSDAGGAFSVPAGYPCPSSTSQLYLVARGGSPAASSGSSNSASVLLSALGSCNAPAPATPVVVNEATTVAAAYALAQFLSPGGNIGASASNSVGLANAFATAGSLVGPLTGSSPGPTFPPNGIAPTARIGSLANLLNSCISAPASTIAGSACAQLFSAATSPGAAVPGNTLDAILNIVRNPGTNVGGVYAQSLTSSAFTPVLSAAPSDWTLFTTFSGGGMKGPSGIGVDAVGNVWVASYFNGATQLSPLGKVMTAASGNGLQNSYGLAIDASSNAWIPNEQSPGSVNTGLGSVTVLSPTGQSLSGQNGFSAGGLNFPISVAIDPNSNAWVVDYGNSRLTLLTSGGQSLSGSGGFTSPLLAFPVAVAVDANHNAWVANLSGPSITLVSNAGTQFKEVACCNGASGLAIDRQGNVWVTNYYSDSVSEISGSGAVLSTGYTAASIHHPQGIAVDGAGTVWIANYRGPSITELAGAAANSPGSSLSPAPGWAPEAGLLEAFAIAIDAGGDLWVSNFGTDTVTEIIGLAAPVKTPLIGPVQLP